MMSSFLSQNRPGTVARASYSLKEILRGPGRRVYFFIIISLFSVGKYNYEPNVQNSYNTVLTKSNFHKNRYFSYHNLQIGHVQKFSGNILSLFLKILKDVDFFISFGRRSHTREPTKLRD